MNIRSKETVLDQVHGLFERGIVSQLTDAQLLERFLRCDGEPAEWAFAVLVARHGAMVLSVCRNVLGNSSDADDAFQATFLVLLRKARRITDQSSCGSWLHGVALRIAADIRCASARRYEHERKASRHELTFDRTQSAEQQQELRGVLDEELGRLRDHDRLPIVLCDLEGCTYEEAAQQLGCPVGTIKSRLARARARLQHRLARRGVAPAVGLAAPANIGVPPSLQARVMGSAAYAVSRGPGVAAGVTSLVQREVRRTMLGRGARLWAVLGGAAIIACAACWAGAYNDPRMPALHSPQGREAGVESPKPNDSSIHVRVIDASGKPIRGVEIESLDVSSGMRSAKGRTDPEGRAVFADTNTEQSLVLIARRGDELGWTAFFARRDRTGPSAGTTGAGAADDPRQITIYPRRRTLKGAIVGVDGKPISGARIIVTGLKGAGNGAASVFGKPEVERDDWPFGYAVTDAQGCYAVSVPEQVSVFLLAYHPFHIGPAYTASADAVTLEPVRLEPAGQIIGTVTDAKTGSPVAGAQLGAQFLEHRAPILHGGYGRTVSDANGRFTISPLAPGVYNLQMWKVPGREQATASAVEALRVRPNEASHADLRVIDGRPLRGIVVDARTTQPIPGVLVGCYGPAHPDSGAAVEGRTTDAKGGFTFHVPPGEQRVYVMQATNSRLGHQTVVVPPEGEMAPVQLVGIGAESDDRNLKRAAAGPVRKARETPKKAAVPAVAKAQRTEAAAPVTERGEQPAPPNVDGRHVAGRVTSPQGTPVRSVNVSVSIDQDSRHTITDQEGIFIFEELPKRDLTLRLQRNGDLPISLPLPAEQVTVEFEYDPTPDPRAAYRTMPPSDDQIPEGIKGRLTFVDLDAKGTQFRVDGPAGAGLDLARLPQGVRRMGDEFYRIGKKLVHVRGRHAQEFPESVNGIAIGARADMLRFLHAVQFGVPDGVKVGTYVLHYADGSTERLSVVYGRHVSNWVSFANGAAKPPTDAGLAWTGTNDNTDLNPGMKIHLYAFSVANPHPDREIESLEVISLETDCDLFLVALTLERAEAPPNRR